MITPRQIRAARAMLEWDISDLATAADLSREAIGKIENGHSQARGATLERIARAFDVAGIEFAEQEGVRMKSQGLSVYEGPERFDDFYELLYERVREQGGDICLSVSDERLLSKYRKSPQLHRERMQSLHAAGKFSSFRILANKSTFAMNFTYNEYRWTPAESLAPTAFYTFGDSLALISFAHAKAPYVVVLRSAPLADAYRQAFNIAWASAHNPTGHEVSNED